MSELLTLNQYQESGRTEIPIGINLGAALPRILIPGQLEAITHRFAEQGYAFVSALPLRGVADKAGHIAGILPIWFLEDAWNPTRYPSILGALEIVYGRLRKDPLAPHLQDLVASPHEAVSRKMYQTIAAHYAPDGITVVAHHIKDAINPGIVPDSVRTLLQINPGMMGLDGELATEDLIYQELEKSRQSGGHFSGITFDLNHVRRATRPDEDARAGKRYIHGDGHVLGKWRDAVETYITETKLVDFQAQNYEELMATISGKQTELADMVTAIKERGYRGPIRVEFNLGVGKQIKPGTVEKVAKDIYEYLAETLNS